jgi:hypothetical protein
LPSWWKVGEFDRYFIEAILKHGMLRFEDICADPTFPFGREIERARLERAQTEGIPFEPNELKVSVTPAKESEWISDAISIRRVEALYELFGQRAPPRRAKKALVPVTQETPKTKLELNKIRKEYMDEIALVKAKFVPLNLDVSNPQQVSMIFLELTSFSC